MSDERTPRSVLAEVIDDIYGQDGWDVAGNLLDALTDDDVRYLARARMIPLHEDEREWVPSWGDDDPKTA